MKFNYTILIISSLVLITVTQTLAQTNDKIEHSEDRLLGRRIKGENVNVLVGNVEFRQPKTIINCDSAIFYPNKNSLEAFGRVKIYDKVDSVTITSRKLTYDGNSRLAKIRENVVYKDDSVLLYTDHLDYDMINRSAKYFNGGRVVDQENTLTSTNGFYDTEANVLTFTNNVKVTNPEYILEGENLVYNLITNIAVINSPNTITRSDGTVLNAEQGSEFNINDYEYIFSVSEIETESYILSADRMFFDDLRDYYKAEGNVKLIGKENEVIVTGKEAYHQKPLGITVIYGDPIMKKNAQGDTLYLTADTLRSIDSEIPKDRRMLGYHNVKVYKTGLRGKADSLSYHLSDSLIYFYNDPILWNHETQITADSISVTINNGLLDELVTKRNSFIISEDSTKNYQQLKGRDMVSKFADNRIVSVDIYGNGESNYFELENNSEALMGMNNIICSTMKIRFKNNRVQTISYYTNPDGKFIPVHELREDEKFLAGFNWRIKERPELWQILDISQEEFEREYNKPITPEAQTEMREMERQDIEDPEVLNKLLPEEESQPK